MGVCFWNSYLGIGITMTIITSATSPTTAQTIINGALRLLQVASIDGWSNESLL